MGFYFSNITYELLGILVAIIACTVAYIKYAQTYWQRRGIQTLPPEIPFGNMSGVIKRQKHFGDVIKENYDIFKRKGAKHCGVYLFWSPNYVPIDIEIIKNILQKDFTYFMDRGLFSDEETDPLSGNMFVLGGIKWKNIRQKLTPTFTSGKMKMMFHTVAACSKGLIELAGEYAKPNTPTDIKDILARFGFDVIGSCAFGIECNCLKDPDAEFRHYGLEAFRERVKGLIPFILPKKLLHHFGFRLTLPEVEDFFMTVVKKTVKYREQNNISRKDFMHLLIQLKNRGVISDDGKLFDEGSKCEDGKLTINELAAQCFVFFLAGYETSSTTSAFTLYELAVNPDVQEKARDEAKRVIEKHGGEITYDGVMEMTYLEKVVCEALRKYPPLATLNRLCTQQYHVPGTDLVLEEGTRVNIPVKGIHYDPEYYPDPEIFDPERFSEENKKTRPSYTWLPFGEGPRICIGLRFGMIQVKVALAALLKEYKFSLNEKTKVPLEINYTFISSVKGGLWLDIERLKK